MLDCLDVLRDCPGIIQVLDHFATLNHGYVVVFPFYHGTCDIPHEEPHRSVYFHKLYEVMYHFSALYLHTLTHNIGS